MHTYGTAVAIDPQYRDATSPVVRVRVLYRADFDPAEYYRRLATFAHYLVKDGKGGDDQAAHFGPGAADLSGFLAQAWRSPHNFMIMLCPDQVHGPQLPLQEFAEVWMQQVQADLGRPLLWIGSVHRDTDEWHVQFLLAGTSQTGEPFRIARPYISETMRARAAEVQSWYLGDV